MAVENELGRNVHVLVWETIFECVGIWCRFFFESGQFRDTGTIQGHGATRLVRSMMAFLRRDGHNHTHAPPPKSTRRHASLLGSTMLGVVVVLLAATDAATGLAAETITGC